MSDSVKGTGMNLGAIRAEHAALDHAKGRGDFDIRCVRLANHVPALLAEVERLRAEIEGWKRYRAGIDEALNSGDGSYRP